MDDQHSGSPRRRDDDRERRRFTDERIEDRFRAVQDELTVLRPLPLEVARAHMRIDALAGDLRDVKDTITAFRSEYREDRDRKRGGRTAIVVAVIAAVATVLASLTVAIASLLGAGA